MTSSSAAIKPSALLQQALPADWTSEEQLLFRNWLQEAVALHDTLTSVAKDRPWLLWRAAKVLHKLRGALVRAAEAAEQESAQKQRQTTRGARRERTD